MSLWKYLAKKLLGNPRRIAAKPRPRTFLFLERLQDRITPSPVLTVNTTADNNVRDDFLSLREAMQVADGQLVANTLTQAEQNQITGNPNGPSYDTIQFNIGNQAETITLTSALPSLSGGPVFINGAAPAGSPNQTISIDGKNVTGPGFDLNWDGPPPPRLPTTTTSGSTIQGLAIENFKGAAIQIESDHNTIGGAGAGQQNTLTGNYNGVVIDGGQQTNTVSTAFNNTVAGNTITKSVYSGAGADTGFGVRIVNGANNNTIGAIATTDPTTHVITTPANVISGNAAANVEISDSKTNQNTVIGNFIGIDKDGKTGLQNGAQGVAIIKAARLNQIGGSAPGAMNVISGNPKGGVAVAGQDTAENTIGGNIIGAAADGSNNHIGNGIAGVVFDGVAYGNVVRESQIKYNSDPVNKNIPGVANPGQKSKVYDPNSITGNDYGIDDGTSNGTPVLTSAVVLGPGLEVQGTLTSTPDTEFILEFFSNPTTDPVGHEQGADYLGSLTVHTDDAGNAIFETGLYGYGADVNLSATATGTADDGWTSQFSNEAPILQATYVTLTSSANPSTAGQAVTFTATVSGSSGGTPTGTVGFYDGTTLLGTAPLGPGMMGQQATFTTSALSVGSHSTTAVYSGDAVFASTTSFPLTQTVQHAASWISLISSSDPSSFGQAVTFTATVSGSGGTPTGTVSFYDGTTLLGTVTLGPGMMGAQATFTISDLSIGDHSITADYSGDDVFAGSDSFPLTQTVH